MARPFRIGATGGLGCSSNPDQSPQLGDGTCRFNVQPEGLGRQRLSTPQDSSQAEPTSTPELIENQQLSGGPSEKYQ
jgi:hypothetical protein